MIYLMLKGRIGNQLFMYAYARTVQRHQAEKGIKSKIIIDDTANIEPQYLNSLQYYSLEDVEYVHNREKLKKLYKFYLPFFLYKMMNRLEAGKSFLQRQIFESRVAWLTNRLGYVRCEADYVQVLRDLPENVILDGYFQSERYFAKNKDEIKRIFSLKNEVDASGYPNLEKIKNRNTVCISIKVQHNVGNVMFDVCNDGYFKKAINYVQEHVDNPLFFICSDNVDYVKEHLIDINKYDVVEQSRQFPLHISLAVMAQCKHFIIGNTSFGWWAQYLSDNPDKVVIAPSRWYGDDTPYANIYQDDWTLMEV